MATPQYIIAARFLTTKALNIDVIASTFKPLWRSKNGFKEKNQGNHIVLFTFDNKEDVDTILANQPWSFDKHLMVLQRYEKDMDVEELPFNLMPFWVQVHGIPIRLRNQRVVEGICETIGPVCSAPDGVDCKGAGFM